MQTEHKDSTSPPSYRYPDGSSSQWARWILAKATHSSGATERGLARSLLVTRPHRRPTCSAKQIPAATETLARSTFGGRPSHVLPSPSSFCFPTPPDLEPQPPAKAYSSYRVPLSHPQNTRTNPIRRSIQSFENSPSTKKDKSLTRSDSRPPRNRTPTPTSEDTLELQ